MFYLVGTIIVAFYWIGFNNGVKHGRQMERLAELRRDLEEQIKNKKANG